MAEVEEFCAAFTQAVGEVGESGFTYTSDFNYELGMAGVAIAAIYDQLGPVGTEDYTYIDSRSCEAEDCMHPYTRATSSNQRTCSTTAHRHTTERIRSN